MMRFFFCLMLFNFCNTFLTAQERPNVILIMTDDQGTIDLNNYGAEDLHTPNLDALAASGVKFTQFYAGAPICSPSRAALLTGLNPHAAGLPSNTSSIPGRKGMPTEQITIAEVFSEAGYRTGHVGKWHLGFSENTMPLAQGFDYSFGHMGGCIDNYSHFFYWNGPNRHDLYENGKEVFRDGEYFQDLMAEKADAFVSESSDDPFFLYYAINLPHYPLQGTTKWNEYYKELPHPRRAYAACISVVDEKIGQLVKTLSAQEIIDNTIIIFQSDHGHSVEERAFHGGGSAGVFRGAKTSLFEGGIRVPAIISWPNKIDANQIRNQVAISMDWFATLADYCNIPIHEIEGKSLNGIITNDNSKTAHEILRLKQGVRWAVRKGEYKLLGLPNDPTNQYRLDPNKDQLFLSMPESAPEEQFNLASKYPEKVEELLKDYFDWEYAVPEDMPIAGEVIHSLAKGKKKELEIAPSKKYFCNGPSTLIDENTGSRYYNDGLWLGFEANNLSATIDLGSVQAIKEIKIGLLQDAASWIFYPTNISYAFSDDDKIYSNANQWPIDPLESMRAKQIERLVIPLNQTARYLKIEIHNSGTCPEWHPNSGGKAWLFIDEITVI